VGRNQPSYGAVFYQSPIASTHAPCTFNANISVQTLKTITALLLNEMHYNQDSDQAEGDSKLALQTNKEKANAVEGLQ